MKSPSTRNVGRREFLQTSLSVSSGAGLTLARPRLGIASKSVGLEVGEGTVDITPATGTLLAGFHCTPGMERRVEDIRQPTAARAIVLRTAGTTVALISVDLLGVSKEMAKGVRSQVAKKTGILASNIRITATHSHSTPTGHPLLHWGGLPRKYLKMVETSIVTAVESALQDLALAEVYVGKTSVAGANFNRTVEQWKNEKDFTKDSSDTERWLDREVHVLHFERMAPKTNILWYHFSAHPVCYTDRQSGPDWPGVVQTIIEREEKLTPSLLQGHIGDVNPGNGEPWLGNPDDTGKLIAQGIQQAMTSSQKVSVEGIRTRTWNIGVPLDMVTHNKQLEQFKKNPEDCIKDEWVSEAFAAAWYKMASEWEYKKPSLATEVSAIALGDVVLFFHAAELFSYYGLRIRHESPFEHSILVGYTNEFIGYMTDPTSHEKREYAAAVVPKIIGFPPFTPDASREFTRQSVGLLKTV